MRSRLLSLAAVAIAALTLACGDAQRVVAPESSAFRVPQNASFNLLGSGRADVAERDHALRSDGHAERNIGPEGGVLSVPDAGLTIIVPPGAVSHRVKIGVRAVKGSAIHYEFEPHGIVFNVPLIAIQRLNGISASSLGAGLYAAYVAHDQDVDEKNGTANIAQVFGVAIDASAGTATFHIPHFSGYILASGRCSNND